MRSEPGSRFNSPISTHGSLTKPRTPCSLAQSGPLLGSSRVTSIKAAHKVRMTQLSAIRHQGKRRSFRRSRGLRALLKRGLAQGAAPAEAKDSERESARTISNVRGGAIIMAARVPQARVYRPLGESDRPSRLLTAAYTAVITVPCQRKWSNVQPKVLIQNSVNKSLIISFFFLSQADRASDVSPRGLPPRFAGLLAPRERGSLPTPRTRDASSHQRSGLGPPLS
jgi:hypothetical protein